MSITLVKNEPVSYCEEIIQMIPSEMHAEIARFFLDGMQISVINGKIGMVSGLCKRIYDFGTNQVFIRYRV